MRRKRSASLERLLRYRDLTKDKTASSLLVAMRGSVAAEDALEVVRVERDVITQWKASSGAAGHVPLEQYEHALELECLASDRVARAQENVGQAMNIQLAAREDYRSSANNAQMVDQRLQRLRKEELSKSERSMADQVSDLWLSRILHAHT